MVEDVAGVIKARRTVLGLTAAELSERTSVGKPLTRAVISDLETGRKKTLDISELLTVAAALDMPPMALLFPNVTQDVEILPGQMMPGVDALGWFSGVGDAAPASVTGPGTSAVDSGMLISFRLVEVETVLRTQRHNLIHHEQGLELEAAGGISMVGGMKDYERENAEHARRQIERLETERADLIAKYRRLIELGNA